MHLVKVLGRRFAVPTAVTVLLVGGTAFPAFADDDLAPDEGVATQEQVEVTPAPDLSQSAPPADEIPAPKSESKPGPVSPVEDVEPSGEVSREVLGPPAPSGGVASDPGVSPAGPVAAKGSGVDREVTAEPVVSGTAANGWEYTIPDVVNADGERDYDYVIRFRGSTTGSIPQNPGETYSRLCGSSAMEVAAIPRSGVTLIGETSWPINGSICVPPNIQVAVDENDVITGVTTGPDENFTFMVGDTVLGEGNHPAQCTEFTVKLVQKSEDVEPMPGSPRSWTVPASGDPSCDDPGTDPDPGVEMPTACTTDAAQYADSPFLRFFFNAGPNGDSFAAMGCVKSAFRGKLVSSDGESDGWHNVEPGKYKNGFTFSVPHQGSDATFRLCLSNKGGNQQVAFEWQVVDGVWTAVQATGWCGSFPEPPPVTDPCEADPTAEGCTTQPPAEECPDGTEPNDQGECVPGEEPGDGDQEPVVIPGDGDDSGTTDGDQSSDGGAAKPDGDSSLPTVLASTGSGGLLIVAAFAVLILILGISARGVGRRIATR